MDGKDFKEIQNQIALEFEHIIKNCYTDLFILKDHNTTGQIFTINLFYGEEYGLRIISWKGRGTKIDIRMPGEGAIVC